MNPDAVKGNGKGFTYSLLGVNGALGNQLWQIAGTVGWSLKSQVSPIFPRWHYEGFFNIPLKYFTYKIPEDRNDLSPDYLQDRRHWDFIEDVIKELFAPSEDSSLWIADRYAGENLKKYVAVHVRRANNIALPDHHPVCPIEYFEEALDRIGNYPVMVFSDDPGWCKEQSIFKDAFYAEGIPSSVNVMELTKYAPLNHSSAALDLLTMAQCSRHVISNSTFSWWGAYLAGSRHTIYPGRWYGPMVKADPSLMFHNLDWERVDFE